MTVLVPPIKLYTTQCSLIELIDGYLQPKQLCPAEASLQGNDIYVASNWHIKVKDIENINLFNNEEDENYYELLIDAGKGRIFRFVQPEFHDERNQHHWDLFIRRLSKLHEKYQSKEVQGFTNFIQSSSKHRLGGTGSSSSSSSSNKPSSSSSQNYGTRDHRANQPSSHRSVLTSMDTNQSNVPAQQHRRQRNVFGSNKTIPPIVPLNDRFDWVSDHHHHHHRTPTISTTSTAAVVDGPKLISEHGTAMKKRTKIKPPLPLEEFSSDDDDKDQVDQSEKENVVENEILDGNAFNHTIVNAVDEVPPPTTTHQRRRTKLRKLKSQIPKRDESSDDDDIFNHPAADVTTPFVQRVVSPHTVRATTHSERSTTLQSTVKKSLLDETDDSTEETTIDKRTQPSINSFFRPKSTSVVRPIDMSSTKTLTSAVPKTPTRITKHTESITSTGRTKIQHSKSTSSAIKMKRYEADDTSWLLKSPSRQLLSPQQKRRKALFGNDPSTLSVNRRDRMDNKNDFLRNDPIEEYNSPPNRSQSKANNHRGSPVVDTTYAYRPLDFSKASRKIVPTLINRFANSTSTLAALMQHSSDIIITSHSSTKVSTNTMSLYRKFRGLRNLGNTCYQNSSLQMLFSCRNLITALQKRIGSWKEGRENGTITKSICTIWQELSKHYMASVDSRIIKNAMDAKTDKYIGYEQRDAHEFVSDLIDFVHEELQSNQHPVADQEVDSSKCDKQRNPLPTDDFCMAVEVGLKCCSCGYSRNKEEMYRHLSIDVISDDEESHSELNDEVVTVSIATIQKSLAHFFQPETREIKCEKCTSGTHAEQTLRILSQPKVLILHLKRFIVAERMVYPATTEIDIENRPQPHDLSSAAVAPQIEYVFKKNKAPIIIPESLSLDPYHRNDSLQTSMHSSMEDVNELPTNSLNNYKLRSIVHHIGSRASSGHYTADAIREVALDISDEVGSDEAKPEVVNKNLEKVWVSFDDGITNETTIDKILSNRFKQSTAYMLLYVVE